METPTPPIVSALQASDITLKLLTLERLLKTLPKSLDEPTPAESQYKALRTGQLVLEQRHIDDLGELGAVNHALELVFKSRSSGGIILKERGDVLLKIIPILCHYLGPDYPPDIILQKWLLDLISAAEAIIKNVRIFSIFENRPHFPDPRLIQPPEVSGGRGKRQAQKTAANSSQSGHNADPEESEPVKAASQASKRKRRGSKQTGSDKGSDSSSSFAADSSDAPTRSPSVISIDGSDMDQDVQVLDNAFSLLQVPAPLRQPKAKNAVRKKRKKTANDLSAEPTEHDPKYIDLPEPVVIPSRGGAPPDPLARKLTIPCHPVNTILSDKNHHYRCIASSVCGWAPKCNSRSLSRIYTHCNRCDALKKWKPELHAEAERALASLAPGAGGSSQKGNTATTTGKSASQPLVPANSSGPPSRDDTFASFLTQGKLELKDRINLAIVRLICAAGIPPRIADYPEWKTLFSTINPKSSYTPPSATTLRDRLIPGEAARVKLAMRDFLKTETNLSISFDGLTHGSQPVYTVHVITPDRRVFLYVADVFYGSHDAEYLMDLLEVRLVFLIPSPGTHYDIFYSASSLRLEHGDLALLYRTTPT